MTCCKSIYILCNPIPSCIYQLVIKTPIISAEVTLRFIDKFNKIYYVTKTANSDREVTIQLREDDTDPNNVLERDLPLGLLNEYAGGFKVMVLDSSNQEVPWTISGVDYDALGFFIRDITPALDSYTLDPTYEPGEVGDFSFDFSGDFFTD